jgi:hypothetical protein
MEETLKAMIASVSEPDSENTLTTEKIHQWLLGQRSRHEEELNKFPQISTEPHFDLMMADYNRSRDGVFIVVVFQSENVCFLAGRGNSLQVREFAETDFPEDVSEVIPELRRRFYTGKQLLTVPEAELNRWLK